MTIPNDDDLRRMIESDPRAVEAMVATEICGWKNVSIGSNYVSGRPPNGRPYVMEIVVPRYLSDANAAMMVVKECAVKYEIRISINTCWNGYIVNTRQGASSYFTQDACEFDQLWPEVILAALAAMREREKTA
jgi:hypothetical protein